MLPEEYILYDECAKDFINLSSDKIKNYFVLTTKTVKKQGLLDYIGIDEKSKHIICYVDSDPTISHAEDIANQLRKSKRKNILAFGGGSVIDVAKSIIKGRENSISSFIVIPTLFGNCSHATSISVLTDDITGYKVSERRECYIPDMVILDPYFLSYIPNEIFKYQIIDTLAHSVETLQNRLLNPLSRFYCFGAIDFLSLGLEMKPEEFVLATTLSGLGMSGVGTTLSHILSYYMSKRFNISHAKAVSMCLREATEFNSEPEFIEIVNSIYDILNDDEIFDKKIVVKSDTIKEVNPIEVYNMYKEKLKNNIREVSEKDFTDLVNFIILENIEFE